MTFAGEPIFGNGGGATVPDVYSKSAKETRARNEDDDDDEYTSI